MSKMTNIFDYINEVSLFHNFFYDYSLVEIICPLHGVFEQRKCECKKCGKLLSTDDVLFRFNIVHGNKYDYTNFKYSGMYNKSEIICLCHGSFYQSALNHISGKGCPKCAKNYRKDKNEIIKKLNILHNNKYDYSETKFKRTKDILKNII